MKETLKLQCLAHGVFEIAMLSKIPILSKKFQKVNYLTNWINQ